MLNITHCQTTAYHSEANSAVKRLHGILKDALRACAAAANWAQELPWVLLGLGAQPREDTGLSAAEAVFETPIVLQNEFLHGEEFSVDNICNNLSKTSDAPAISLSNKRNSSRLLLEELPAPTPRSLRLSPPRRCHPPFQRPYNNPCTVLRHGPHSFTIRVGSREEIVSS
jgi:hypothetical protein